MNKLPLYTKQIWFALGLACTALTVMAFTFKPVAPSIEVFFGEEIVANNHASFEIENGTDWETFYGVADDAPNPIEIRTYTIRNTGDAPLSVQNISIENLSDESFSIVEEPANSTIASGDSASFKVGFTIRGYKVAAAKIGITTNDPVIPTYYMFLMAHSVECPVCPNNRNNGVKCDTCIAGFSGAPLCEDCENPLHGGKSCDTCKDKYNPDTYPSCNECRTTYMINDCTECVFPGQDIKTYCNTCEDPNKRWPRCYM